MAQLEGVSPGQSPPQSGEQNDSLALNGRTCFTFDMGTRISPRRSTSTQWLTQSVSGLLLFTDAIVTASPSRIWLDLFSWTPTPQNPRVWGRDGREVARFERRLGPRRNVYSGDFVFRQPSLSRWTCLAEASERVSQVFPASPQRQVRFDVRPLGGD